MMIEIKYDIVSTKAYRAVGMKWDGPWSEIHGLKNVVQTMTDRVDELSHAVEPNMQLGLSYHYRPDGFTHYSMFEASEEQEVPEDMIEINVPALTYFVTKHEKGMEIGNTYYKISRWLKGSDYQAFKERNVTYYDEELPIKHEKYPLDQELNDPHFEICIPIVKK